MAEIKKKDWKRTAAYKALKKDLMDGLIAASLDSPKYCDLVDEYMICWCQVQELNQDLMERGMRVRYENGSQSGLTENKSLGYKIRMLKTMDDIFRRLGYQDEAREKRIAAARENADGEDDEL